MITIDTREPEEYIKLGDRTQMLKYGDARVSVGHRRVLLERKTVSDFWSSLQSGRLNEQLSHCGALVLIDSRDAFMPRGVWDRLYEDDRLRMMVNGVARHTCVQVCTGPKDYLALLRLIERQLAMKTYRVLKVRRTVDRTLDDELLGPLVGVPGIGAESADLILAQFKTLTETFNNVQNWSRVRGIGDKRVEVAREFMNREYVRGGRNE